MKSTLLSVNVLEMKIRFSISKLDKNNNLKKMCL